MLTWATLRVVTVVGPRVSVFSGAMGGSRTL